MKKILSFVVIVSFINCSNTGQLSSDLPPKFQSGRYSFEFSIERFRLNKDQIIPTELIYGQIYRKNSLIISKSPAGLGIADDSLCLFIDDSLKIITLDGRLTMNPKLLTPFYDPLSFFSYANKFKNSYKKTSNTKSIKHDFEFSADTIPVTRIVIIENKNDNSCVIEFSYLSLQDKFKDIIFYKSTPDLTSRSGKNISDFIVLIDGKYRPHQNFKDYTLFDATSLGSLFND
jgi:hypothetical protein